MANVKSDLSVRDKFYIDLHKIRVSRILYNCVILIYFGILQIWALILVIVAETVNQIRLKCPCLVCSVLLLFLSQVDNLYVFDKKSNRTMEAGKRLVRNKNG